MTIAIVIVPASFSPSELYSSLESELQNVGFKATTVALPSVGLPNQGKKPGRMLDDAAEIAAVVERVYKDPDTDEIVLLSHSYGGVPAAESMKMVSAKNRRPGVSRMIYLAAIALPVGLSNNEMRKRPPPDHLKIEGDWMIMNHFQNIPYDFNDLPSEEGQAWAAKHHQQSVSSFNERATYAGYNDAEVLYVRCTNDQCLPAEATKRILGLMEQSSGKSPEVFESASGHNPHISKPRELAEFVKGILK